jgi:hypothetical protein
MSVTRPKNVCLIALLAAATLIGLPAEARITNIVISSTTSPAFGGASFGSVGQYEQLDGTASGEIDPHDPLNSIITDIELAPRNSRGMVEYSMSISILRPVDARKGNHILLYDVVNRGNKLLTGLNIGGSATTPGDGFLESEGYTMVWSGWEGDIAGGIRINLPVAKNRDGSSITGQVRGEYIFGAPATTMNTSAIPAYAAVSTDNSSATLTRRVHQHDAKERIPNSQWAFADCTATPFPGVPSTTKVCLQGGFDTNHIYEIVYTAVDPTVAGTGFAATRDFISFLRNGNGPHRGGHDRDCRRSDTSGPANPLGDTIDQAIIYGSSQSGRWIRTWLQLGFNQDERRHQVVEGAMPHIASNRGAFNVRFAQPTRLSGTQHTEAQFPGPESPSTWGVSRDSIAGVTGGQLDRCRMTHSCPVIIQTVSDTEFWQSLMSLNVTDSEGRHDIPLPKEVRLFQFSSTHHGGGNPLAQPPAVLPAVPANGQLRANSNPYVWHQRALLVALRQWVVNGQEPPASLYSSLHGHSLAKPDQVRVPYIPAVNARGTPFTYRDLGDVMNQKFLLDRGHRFDVEDVSGVMKEPPEVGEAYNTLVPQVNADGNDIDGLRNVNVQVPLGTYMGWNIRKAGFSQGDSTDLTGGFIPFFKTKAERLAAGDPRLSLEERYPTHQAYVDAIAGAAKGLVSKRLLLQKDADDIVAAAQAAAVP